MSLLVVEENPISLKSINKISLSEKKLGEVEWVHAWLEENYQAIFGKLNYEIIGHEVDISGEGPEGCLDFLAIDLVNGDVVILECKRDDFKHRDLIGQAIEYAAGISKFTLEKLNTIYNEYIKPSIGSIEGLYAQYNGSIPEINSKQKMVLVVQNSNKNEGSYLRLKSQCSYLRGLGIDINILEMKWYSKNEGSSKPEKGDIIEFSFVWDEEPKAPLERNNIKSNKLISENEFLLDKTDKSIELYNALIDTMNEIKDLKYKLRPNSQWITFYRKGKAFMVVIFREESIILRFRLEDNYVHGKLTKLSVETDKLSKQDNFLYQIEIKEIKQFNDIEKYIIDSINYNS